MCQQIRFIDHPGLEESQRGRGQNLAVYRGAVPFSVGGYLVDHPLADRPIFFRNWLCGARSISTPLKGELLCLPREAMRGSRRMDRKHIQTESCHSFDRCRRGLSQGGCSYAGQRASLQRGRPSGFVWGEAAGPDKRAFGGGAHLAGGKHALKLMESKHSNEVCGGNSAV